MAEKDLEKRIAELESQLEESKKDDTNSSRDRARNRKNQLVRGVAHASFAGVGAVADVFSTLASSVLDRNQGGNSDSAEDTNRRVFGDVTSGISDAIEEMIEVPGKMADRFSERYNDRK